jgi:nucleosome binding factor SPN SPT16 subunit
MGLEFRESSYVLSSKNPTKLAEGMVLNLATGFQNLELPDVKDKKLTPYALMLSDTVVITHDGCLALTTLNKDLAEISYMFKEPEKEQKESKDKSADENKPAKVKTEPAVRETTKSRTTVLATKTRGEGKEDGVSDEQRRREHQKSLFQLKQTQGLERFSGDAQAAKANAKAAIRRVESYKKDTQLPPQTKDNRILVDRRNETILLPVFGLSVPFHVSTIKNISKSDEGEYTYLRFNFITPGQTLNKSDTVVFEDSNSTFVRALTFKSGDVGRFNDIYRLVNDLKKEVVKREQERKDYADLVVQERLSEIKGRRPQRLLEVYARPAMDGKRAPGDLEIHMNGLRYVSQVRNDQKIGNFSNLP